MYTSGMTSRDLGLGSSKFRYPNFPFYSREFFETVNASRDRTPVRLIVRVLTSGRKLAETCASDPVPFELIHGRLKVCWPHPVQAAVAAGE